jgi:hypothetical protein
LRNNRIPSHLLENKTLAARDKSTSKCTFTLCKMQAYASWPEHALSPIGGAESRCPLLSAIRACGAASSIRAFQRQKLGKTSLLLALKCWRGTATPPEEARCSIN